MTINIGEVDHPEHGQIRIEISNDEEFIARVKQISKGLPGRGLQEKLKHWKIKTIGQDRVPAAIQKMMGEEAKDLDRLGEAIKDLESVQAEHGATVPKNPVVDAADTVWTTATNPDAFEAQPRVAEKPVRPGVRRARPGGKL